MKKILLGLLLTSSLLINAQTFYVSPSGSDSNNGYINSPWKTIQHAANMIPPPPLKTPYTVIVKQGVYNEYVLIQKSGTATNPVTFKVNTGDIVTLDGEKNIGSFTIPDQFGLLSVLDANYITLDGFRCINAGDSSSTSIFNIRGIAVENGDFITIKNNYTYNTVSSGILVFNSSNIIIDKNEVVRACNDGEQECISVGKTDTFTISNNTVHDNGGSGRKGGEGIDAKEGANNGLIFGNNVYNINRDAALNVGGTVGIYVEAWNVLTQNIRVYNNKVHDIIGDGITLAAEEGGPLKNIDVYNNLSYNNKFTGIFLATNDNGTIPRKNHPLDSIRIINNTIYNNGTGGWGGGIYSDNPETSNITIRNNIVSDNQPFQIGLETNVTASQFIIDNNLIFGSTNHTIEVYGVDTVACNPMFTNTAIFDFNLQTSSCAINSGKTTNAPDKDYNGVDRPQSGIDIGAYEITTAVGIDDPNSLKNEISVYPNPSSGIFTINLDDTNLTTEVFNSIGELVLTIQNSNLIDLTNYTNGIYNIKINGISQTVVKQ